MFKLVQKLKATKKALKDWKSAKFNSVDRRIKALRSELSTLLKQFKK